mgnify:CR=1 FL=1
MLHLVDAVDVVHIEMGELAALVGNERIVEQRLVGEIFARATDVVVGIIVEKGLSGSRTCAEECQLP